MTVRQAAMMIVCVCVDLDATDDASGYSLYLEFSPGIKHSSKNQVPLMNEVLEV